MIGATLAPFDVRSYHDILETIPSREFFLLHFRFVLRFSTYSRCYYAPFSPHPEHSPTFSYSTYRLGLSACLIQNLFLNHESF
jgi:hypothetical protein